ncbi:hypothetical protein AB6A40_011299 [Gnathostoma spinigerum]|uniref:Uncharacterized protein n=1 Tax=Gnathostoma spinigerum TaxID=75299 RepID=A0ABD6EXB1_9BILA
MELTRNGPEVYSAGGNHRQELTSVYKPVTSRAPSTDADNLETGVRFTRNHQLFADSQPNHMATKVYKSTTTLGSTSSSKRSYSKLAEVYSNSGDTVEFAQNISKYVSSVIPPFISISLLLLAAIWGFILIITGSLNIHLCSMEPMVPVFLIVDGVLLMLFASVQIYNLWPSQNSQPRDHLTMNLICRGVEGLLLIASVVWLVLGNVVTSVLLQLINS